MTWMRRLGAVGLAALGLFTLASASAVAYFTTSGAGSAAAGVSKLAAPSIASAEASPGGTVALAWSPVTAPGPGAVTYGVDRDGKAADGSCAAVLKVTTCVDNGVAAGRHEYVVTAHWRSWTTAGEETAVNVEGEEEETGVDHLVLNAGTTAPEAGEADDLTLTAVDGAGDPIDEYSGSHNITFSGAEASPSGKKPTVTNSSGKTVNFGSVTKLSFSSGVATVSGSKNGTMVVYAAGAAEIEASDGTLETEVPLSLLVSPGAATKLTLSAATTTPVAGEADALTIAATDAYGNTATSYSGSHELAYSGASASPGGNTPTVSDASGNEVAFGTATPTSFEAGTASVAGEANGVMRLYESGAATVKVSDGTLSATLATTTSVAATAKLQLAAATATPVSAAADNLTVTAQDPYANTTTSYTGVHELTFSGAAASPSGAAPTVVNSSGGTIAFGGATALNFKSGVATVSKSKNGVMTLYAASPAELTVSDGALSSPTPLAVTVSPGAAARFALSGVGVSAGALSSGCLFACTLTGLGNKGTVTAKVAVTDASGNTVSSLGGGHAAAVTTSGSGTIVGTPLPIPSSGPAESASAFTFSSKSSGNFSETITVAKSEGTAYTSATLAASR